MYPSQSNCPNHMKAVVLPIHASYGQLKDQTQQSGHSFGQLLPQLWPMKITHTNQDFFSTVIASSLDCTELCILHSGKIIEGFVVVVCCQRTLFQAQFQTRGNAICHGIKAELKWDTAWETIKIPDPINACYVYNMSISTEIRTLP